MPMPTIFFGALIAASLPLSTGTQLTAATSKNCTSYGSICRTLCLEADSVLQKLHSPVKIPEALCISTCEKGLNTNLTISENCVSSLCEWGGTQKILEAYYSSSKALSGLILSFLSILTLTQNPKDPTIATKWGSPIVGHLKNFGQYDACSDIGGSTYCLTKLQLDPKNAQFKYGPFATCVPQACSSQDVNNAFGLAAEAIMISYGMLSNSSLLAPSNRNGGGGGALGSMLHTTCGDKEYPWTTGAVVMIVVVSLIAGTVILASLLLYLRSKHKKHNTHSPKTINGTETERQTRNANRNYPTDTENQYQRINNEKKTNASFGSQALSSMSLQTSWKSFFQLRAGTGTESMDGVRVFSMSWVIFGHTIVWGFTATDQGYTNVNDVLPYTDSSIMATWAGQALQSAEFSVDTFFLMSGFLAAFISLKKLRGKGAKDIVASAPIMYLHRWLRITPVYMLIVWFYVEVIPLTMSGPAWDLDKEISSCRENWWRNLLYIQTVRVDHPSDLGCYGVSWYLADDMIFFWATPFLLAIYALSKVWGVVVPTLLCVGSIVGSWILAWKKHLTFGQGEYQSHYYFPPWTRCPPYLIGIVGGMLYFEWRERKMNIPKNLQTSVQLLVGSISAVLLGSTCYGIKEGVDSEPYTLTSTENEAYIALSKPAWSIGVSCMLFLCFENLGGPVQWMLSLPVFGYISKLTFLMYLLHPITLGIMFFNRVAPSRFTVVWFSVNFIAALTFTMALAFVLFLLIESPLASLEALFMKYITPNKKRTKRSNASNGNYGYEANYEKLKNFNEDQKDNNNMVKF